MRIQIGDTRVFDYTILGPPTELLLHGASVGSTTMFFWFGDRADPANQTVLAFQVNVLPDPDVKRRLEEVYKALQDEINKAFPDAYVCLTLVGDKLVVSGEVKDAIEATRVILHPQPRQRPATAQNPVLNNPAGGTNVNLNLTNPYPIGFIPGIPEGQLRPDLSNYILPGEIEHHQPAPHPRRTAGDAEMTLAVGQPRGGPRDRPGLHARRTTRASPTSAITNGVTARQPADCARQRQHQPADRSAADGEHGPQRWPSRR